MLIRTLKDIARLISPGRAFQALLKLSELAVLHLTQHHFVSAVNSAGQSFR